MQTLKVSEPFRVYGLSTMPNTNNADRHTVLAKFRETAEKLAASDDAEKPAE